VIVVEDLKYDKDDACVYVVDEIDAMLEKSALIIKKDESGPHPGDLQHWAYGLVAVYHSKQAYFFSATYDKYHRKLLRQVYNIDQGQILDCKSQQEISRNQELEAFESRTVVRETEKDLREAFLKDLEEGIFNKPQFIFEALFEPELRKEVHAMCKTSEVVCEHIVSVDDAIKMRTKY